ncbi:MAG: flagellar motor protein MotB, partial [Flavobacteriaceae bacterium]|nr:flagellar motor protein MotB [Flavobacteriaceae bacterium]
MNLKSTITVLLLSLIFSGQFIAQTKQRVATANKDFENYDYIDAQKVYLKVVEHGYHSAEIYERLGDTYYFNGDYISSARWYGKLLDTYPAEYDTEFYYRAAQSMKSAESLDKANELMEKFLSMGGELPKDDVFYDDPDFLKELGLQPSKYVVESVETNSKYSDFGPAYFNDKLVFSASSKDIDHFGKHNWNNLPYLDLFIADMAEDGTLSNARELAGDINTKYHDASPAFTKDGRTMYFTRNNFLGGRTGSDSRNTIKLKLYRATSSDGEVWGNVEELPFNSNHYSTSHPTLSKDEKRLYFASDMPGTLGNSDLW